MNTKTTTITLAVLAIATVAIVVASTTIANPALASSNGNSVSKSDIRDVGKFLKYIANHGGNDISKNKAQRCVDRFLG
jgi:predicted transcriptional regulator